MSGEIIKNIVFGNQKELVESSGSMGIVSGVRAVQTQHQNRFGQDCLPAANYGDGSVRRGFDPDRVTAADVQRFYEAACQGAASFGMEVFLVTKAQAQQTGGNWARAFMDWGEGRF